MTYNKISIPIELYIDDFLEFSPFRNPSDNFIRTHTNDIWACDFLQLYDAWFRPIFAFFVVKHGSREVVHFNVTRSPTDEWTAQQLRDATPWGEGPRRGRL